MDLVCHRSYKDAIAYYSSTTRMKPGVYSENWERRFDNDIEESEPEYVAKWREMARDIDDEEEFQRRRSEREKLKMRATLDDETRRLYDAGNFDIMSLVNKVKEENKEREERQKAKQIRRDERRKRKEKIKRKKKMGIFTEADEEAERLRKEERSKRKEERWRKRELEE